MLVDTQNSVYWPLEVLRNLKILWTSLGYSEKWEDNYRLIISDNKSTERATEMINKLIH